MRQVCLMQESNSSASMMIACALNASWSHETFLLGRVSELGGVRKLPFEQH